ncbi:MAG: hypothetical protein ABIK68_14585 [bacterium]
MKNYIRLLVSGVFLIMMSQSVTAVERRKPQFASDSAYLVLPMPYSLPGIGEGVMLTALGANIWGTYTDVFAMVATGDITGMFGGLMDVHLIDETLFIDVFVADMSAQMNSYKNRGMAEGDDAYQILSAKKRTARSFQATLSFFERQFEIVYEYDLESITMDKILSEEGEVLVEIRDPEPEKREQMALSVVLDLTDDRQDPLKGFRLQAEWNNSPRTAPTAADYHVLNLGISAYIPIGQFHTWAFNYQASEAVVTDRGDTNRDNIIRERGLSCATYAACSASEQRLIDKYVTERTYGTASSLGGDDRLRAYPMGRFKGAHMAYAATEFRWNFATNVVPFDFWIWKDIATGFQLAVFHEIGSVAETRGDLWQESRASTGIGLRMVSASGFVYRADIAVGDEAHQTTIMFNYPW